MSKDFFPRMLGKISGDFENFILPGKVIKVEFFFHFCPEKKLGTF
jgi:hypothetical protein